MNTRPSLLLALVVAAGLLTACANNPGYSPVTSPGGVSAPPSEGGYGGY